MGPRIEHTKDGFQIISPGLEGCRVVGLNPTNYKELRQLGKHISTLSEISNLEKAFHESNASGKGHIRQFAIVRLLTCFDRKQGFEGVQAASVLNSSQLSRLSELKTERDKFIAHSDDVSGSPFLLAAVDPNHRVKKIFSLDLGAKSTMDPENQSPFDIARAALSELQKMFEHECDKVVQDMKDKIVPTNVPDFSINIQSSE